MDLGLLVLVGAILAVGIASIVAVRRWLRPFSSAAETDGVAGAGEALRGSAGRAAALLLVGLGVAAIASMLASAQVSAIRELLVGTPLLAATAGLLAFAALPPAIARGAGAPSASLTARRVRDLVPRSWFGVLCATATTLILLAAASLLVPVENGADGTGFDQAFASDVEPAVVISATSVLMAAIARALRRVMLIPALSARPGADEARLRGLLSRLVLAVGVGALLVVLAWVTGRWGGAAWMWATLDGGVDAAPWLGALAVVLIAFSAISGVSGLAAWIASAALIAALLRPAHTGRGPGASA